MMRSHRLTLGTLMTAAALLGCSSSNVIGPANNLEVANLADNFQLQATALDNVSQTLIYDWTNTGTTANVDQSGSISAGSATLTILDDAGTQVYTKSLSQTGSFTTSAGTTGTWTIRVVLDGVNGNLNFRVQKP